MTTREIVEQEQSIRVNLAMIDEMQRHVEALREDYLGPINRMEGALTSLRRTFNAALLALSRTQAQASDNGHK